MLYINPFDLSKTIDFNSDEKSLQKLKKLLLAEIDLHESLKLNYRGIELSKDDIIKIFMECENEQIVKHHLLIHSLVDLQDFLTFGKDTLLYKPDKDVVNALMDKTFADFVIPYFKTSYSKILLGLIKNKKVFQEKTVLDAPYFKFHPEYYTFFEEIQLYFGEIIIDVKNAKQRLELTKNDYELNIELNNLYEIIKNKFNPFVLNNLPEEFNSIRDELKLILYNFNFKIYERLQPKFKKIDFKKYVELIKTTNEINTNNVNLKSLSRVFYNTFNKLAPENTYEETNVKSTIFIILVTSLFLIRIFFTCNNMNRNTDHVNRTQLSIEADSIYYEIIYRNKINKVLELINQINAYTGFENTDIYSSDVANNLYPDITSYSKLFKLIKTNKINKPMDLNSFKKLKFTNNKPKSPYKTIWDKLNISYCDYLISFFEHELNLIPTKEKEKWIKH